MNFICNLSDIFKKMEITKISSSFRGFGKEEYWVKYFGINQMLNWIFNIDKISVK